MVVRIRNKEGNCMTRYSSNYNRRGSTTGTNRRYRSIKGYREL